MLVDYCIKIIRVTTLWEEILMKKDNHMDVGEIIEELIVKQHVLADYGNKRIYRLEGADLKLNPMSQFPDNDKGYKTYFDYFKNEYKFTIRDKKQFLVYSIRYKYIKKDGKDVKIEERIHLVPEMLKATGLTDEQRNNYQLMKEVAEYTKLDPNTRMKYNSE